MSRRLLFWLIFPPAAIGVVCIMLMTLPHWHPQTRNLIAVGHWSDRHKQQVAEFARAENLHLKLYGFTGAGGTVGVQLTSATQEQFWRARDLLHSLNPPRPIYWNLSLHTTATKQLPTFTIMERLSGLDPTTTSTIQTRIDKHLRQLPSPGQALIQRRQSSSATSQAYVTVFSCSSQLTHYAEITRAS